MDTPRLSPLHHALEALRPDWTVIDGMPAPLRVGLTVPARALALTDASCLPRLGVKGPHAEEWLRSQGLDVPGVNAWLQTSAGAFLARLARSEFFLEDRVGGPTVARLRDALCPSPGVYPVIRQDAALLLQGERVNDLLVQTCNVDFQAWPPDQQSVVMTSMVGVSVLVAWQRQDGLPRYRIWCDGTFGAYLWETLLDIAVELGGGATGLQALLPGVAAQER
jgi:sarcosine oxidase subunit gamma